MNDTPVGSSRLVGTLVLVVMLFSVMSLNTTSAQAPTESSVDLCSFEVPDKPVYKSSFVWIKQKRFIKQGEAGEISIVLKNEGNMPWISEEANCEGVSTAWLGTSRKKDRDSIFYNPASDSGWHSPNRILMQEKRVNPGETASFKFSALADVPEDYYREYFTPLIDGVTWIEDGLVSLNIQVGPLKDSAEVINQKRQMMYFSMPASRLNLDGKHSLQIDIKHQKMYAMIDDVLIDVITTSTGAYDTPTPLGELEIAGKDRVRIGGKSPHYIMPYFMQLKRPGGSFRGYGIHDFPAYGNANMRSTVRQLLAAGKEVPNSVYAGDWMWEGAKYDMGRRVSHGCIRNDNAAFVYNFMDVGDKVMIYADLPTDHPVREQLDI